MIHQSSWRLLYNSLKFFLKGLFYLESILAFTDKLFVLHGGLVKIKKVRLTYLFRSNKRGFPILLHWYSKHVCVLFIALFQILWMITRERLLAMLFVLFVSHFNLTVTSRWQDHGQDLLAPVVQRANNSIHRIKHYPVDSVLCFLIIYPLDSDLSGG